MTSVVDTSVKHFRSDMVGAPVLNGTAGSMLAVLSACLVDGFDVKAATTLVVASGVATLSFGGSHSATVDSVVLISGVTGALVALNGEQKITAIGAGLVKFATAAADSTAAGTVSFKMAPAGWTKAFSGTNLAVYQSTDAASTKMFLRVDDTAAARARVVGYEQMTDINTGTGPFPTATQMTGGGYWAKSQLASAAPVPWVLVADSRKLLLHASWAIPSSATYLGGVTMAFGDEQPLRPGGDSYACALTYSINATLSQSDGGPDMVPTLQAAMPRNYTGLGSSVLHAVRSYIYYSGLSGTDSTLGSFPPPIDGGLRLSPKFLSESMSYGTPRCNYPGLFHVPQSLVFDTFKARDVVTGTGALAGRKLMAFAPTSTASGSNSGNTGISFVDITGPWAR